MQFNHVTIVGVGLIGGSFALAMRRAGIAERITGWDRPEALEKALKLGVINGIEQELASGGRCGADLVYLAAPVGGILSFLRTRGSSFKPGAIITDAGSTKREVCRVAQESLPSEVAFVGGHPMAGSEKTGVEFADAELFRGAAYAVVANESTNAESVNAVFELVNAIGAVPIALTAEQHDRIAARISHTPQMLATALAVATAKARDPEALLLAGSGFAEMARIAESQWSVWEDICRTNGDEIASALDSAIGELEAIRVAISSGNFSELEEMFGTASQLMQQFHNSRMQKVN